MVMFIFLIKKERKEKKNSFAWHDLLLCSHVFSIHF